MAINIYLTFAYAARRLSIESYEFCGGDILTGAGAIDGPFDVLVRDAADVVVAMSWHPRMANLRRLRRITHSIMERAEAISDVKVQQELANAQVKYGRLPGALDELVDKYRPDAS